MPGFEENLQTLPDTQHIQQIVLLDADFGNQIAVIENRPGKAGSVRIYAAVASRNNGLLDKHAAMQALKLYAGHVDDARRNPGKHPNIDRLFAVIDERKNYRVVIVCTEGGTDGT